MSLIVPGEGIVDEATAEFKEPFALFTQAIQPFGALVAMVTVREVDEVTLLVDKVLRAMVFPLSANEKIGATEALTVI